MTVAVSARRMTYTGNGSTSVYSYNFRIFEDSDLTITVRSTDDTETELTLTTDYTVSGEGDLAGGSVTLVNASQSWLTSGSLKSGYILVIRGVLDLAQDTSLRNQEDYFPEDVEDEFDRGVMIAQQQQDAIDRCLKLPETLVASTFDPTLPTDLADNIGSAIIVNAAGDGFTTGIATNGTDSARVAKVGDTMTGNLTFNALKGTKLGDADSSNFVTLKAPTTVTADYSLSFPGTGPTGPSKFLKYDGTNYAWSDPNGTLSAQAATYTVTTTDGFSTIAVTTGASNRTVNLPAAASSANRILKIKKVDSGAGTVTIDGNASETIDGSTTKTLIFQYETMTIQCDGSNWHILDRLGLLTTVTSYTPTGSWSTNTTYSGKWSRAGEYVEIWVKVATSGAPTSASLTVNLPSGMTIDTTKLHDSTVGDRPPVGYASVFDSATETYKAAVTYASTTSVALFITTASGTYTDEDPVTQAVPITFGANDGVNLYFKVPLVEFAL